jgi:hypothetical protein
VLSSARPTLLRKVLVMANNLRGTEKWDVISLSPQNVLVANKISNWSYKVMSNRLIFAYERVYKRFTIHDNKYSSTNASVNNHDY